jgi:hypothetical protein
MQGRADSLEDTLLSRLLLEGAQVLQGLRTAMEGVKLLLEVGRIRNNRKRTMQSEQVWVCCCAYRSLWSSSSVTALLSSLRLIGTFSVAKSF